jgi:hypothetical protein
MVRALKPRRGDGGVIYYQQIFDIVLLFGLTELKAQMSWMEDVRRLCLVPAHFLIHFIAGRRKAVRILRP